MNVIEAVDTHNDEGAHDEQIAENQNWRQFLKVVHPCCRSNHKKGPNEEWPNLKRSTGKSTDCCVHGLNNERNVRNCEAELSQGDYKVNGTASPLSQHHFGQF